MLFRKLYNNKKQSAHSKVSGTAALLPPLWILLLQACQRINSYELVSRLQFWNYRFNIIVLQDWKSTLSVQKCNIGCGFQVKSVLRSSLRILNLGLSNTYTPNNCQRSHKKASGFQRHSEFFMWPSMKNYYSPLHYRKPKYCTEISPHSDILSPSKDSRETKALCWEDV